MCVHLCICSGIVLIIQFFFFYFTATHNTQSRFLFLKFNINSMFFLLFAKYLTLDCCLDVGFFSNHFFVVSLTTRCVISNFLLKVGMLKGRRGK